MKNVTKKDIALIVVFSLTFVFNLLIFNQFDVILHNQNEFGLAAGEVVWFFLLTSLLTLVVLIGTLLLLCRFCKLAYKIVLCTLFGFTLATYAQVLFFNGNSMNTIDGSAIFTGVSTFGIVFNCLIFIVIIGLPSLLMFTLRRKQALIQKIILLFCVVILGMQFVGLVGTAANVKKLDENAKFYYFSVDDYLQVSENENIIVFVMDRLSTKYVERVFDKWGDEATEIFDGFTWYKDNLSEFRSTFPSVVKTITGVEFTEAQSQTEFLPDAWAQNQVFKALKKHNYRVNGLLDSYSTYYDIAEVQPYFDNIKSATKDEVRLNYGAVWAETTNIAFMRNMPFACKNWFSVKDYSNLANTFVDLSQCDGYFPKAASPETDLFYYHAIKDNQLTANQAQNTFSFVHLNSAHNPFKFDENLNKKKQSGIYSSEQAYGSLKILGEYFAQLKNLHDANGTSIFDKSTIIVLADHGSYDHGEFVEDSYEFAYSGQAYASLFIKRAGETADVPMYTNTTAQMSNRNLAATILKLLGEDCDDNSYFDIDPDPKSAADTELTQTRYFYHTGWHGWDGDFRSITTLDEIATIDGNAYQPSSWHKTSV